jgi:hypothetical protein
VFFGFDTEAPVMFAAEHSAVGFANELFSVGSVFREEGATDDYRQTFLPDLPY